jgi:hypothetical protein
MAISRDKVTVDFSTDETNRCSLDDTKTIFFFVYRILYKLPIDISYIHTKFGVKRPKQTQVIERKVNFFFSNNDLDHWYLGSNKHQDWCQ